MPVRKKSGNGLFYGDDDDDDDADTSDVDVEDDTDSDGIVLPTTRTSSSLASSGSFAEMTLRLQNHGIICTPKTDGSTSCIRRPRPSGSILKKTSKFTTS